MKREKKFTECKYWNFKICPVKAVAFVVVVVVVFELLTLKADCRNRMKQNHVLSMLLI
jgi:hypothetical protein